MNGTPFLRSSVTRRADCGLTMSTLPGGRGTAGIKDAVETGGGVCRWTARAGMKKATANAAALNTVLTENQGDTARLRLLGAVLLALVVIR